MATESLGHFSATEELKERLQKKIEAFRENRKAKERLEVADEAKRWRDKQQQATKQRHLKRNRCAHKPPKDFMQLML